MLPMRGRWHAKSLYSWNRMPSPLWKHLAFFILLLAWRRGLVSQEDVEGEGKGVFFTASRAQAKDWEKRSTVKKTPPFPW